MHRYTGGDDIPVGSPIAGRNRTEIEPLIGFFVNTLVLRGDLSGNPSFRTFLGRTREAALGAYAHQDVPFEKLVEELHPERNLSHPPFFQVMFVLQNALSEAAELPGLQVAPKLIHSGTSKFDLTFFVRELRGALDVAVEYDTDLFEAETIRRMLGHYQTLLEGIIANPDQRLSDLPLLTSAERHQLLAEWNRTEVAYPNDRCLHELIEEQVERTPDAVAVAFEDKQLTYRQLDERANQLARYLQRLGVGPDTLVGICVERSLEMVVGLLGILKAGGAFVPMDPEYPEKRLAFIVEDGGMDVLLTQAHLAESLPARHAQIVRLDTDWPAIAAESPSRARSAVTAGHLAYMIYTSGSTGAPKGVLVEHGPLVQHCVECREFYGLTSNDRVLQFASLSFDAAIEQILPPLLSGARVALREAMVWTPGEFQRKLAELGLTVINLPPAYWRQLAEGWANFVEPISVHQLRLVIIGGDAMTAQTLQLWRQTPLNSVRLLNAYGPTETVVTATSFEIPACGRGQAPLERIPIGRPRGARQIYLLDRWGQPAPVGVAGELHIGGTALARGYHNRRELTAEKFVADPFSDSAGARLYRTGDLARYLADGNIEFLGRVDQQVKIRGFRIELGEIESALSQHAAVRETLVVAREDEAQEKRLVAYVLAKGKVEPSAGELRGFLREKLPEYMIPSAFVTLDCFPLTPNGKVDRRALPKPDLQSNPAGFVPPASATEKTLANIWGEVLRIKQVGRHDNFFELGGHSLLVVQVIGEISRVLKVNMTIAEVFLNPTVQQLAKVIAERLPMERRGQRVITLREGDAAPAVYFVFANSEEFRLAQLFDEGRPVFAIEAPWPTAWLKAAEENRVSALPKMEEVVAPYVAALHAHAGASPCILAGFCQAGYLAFEAAHQFKRQGGNVETVFLFDVFGNRGISLGSQVLLRLRQIQREAPSWSAGPLSKVVGYYARALWLKTLRMFSKVVEARRSMFVRSPEDWAPFFDEQGATISWQAWFRWLGAMRDSYSPRCLDSRGVLVRSLDQQDLDSAYSSLFWQDLFARGLEVIDMSEGHLSIARDAQKTLGPKRKVGDLLRRRYANDIGGT